uniref:TFIIS N-terminal domain-containing protein n=1 Tax=Rhabditophanes sp. KR3021 TaxID=114890 RepID=A0AC35TWK3_9BILA
MVAIDALVIPNRILFESCLQRLRLNLDVYKTLRKLMDINPSAELLVVTKAIKVLNKFAKSKKSNFCYIASLILKKWKSLVVKLCKNKKINGVAMNMKSPQIEYLDTFQIADGFKMNVFAKGAHSVSLKEELNKFDDQKPFRITITKPKNGGNVPMIIRYNPSVKS